MTLEKVLVLCVEKYTFQLSLKIKSSCPPRKLNQLVKLPICGYMQSVLLVLLDRNILYYSQLYPLTIWSWRMTRTVHWTKVCTFVVAWQTCVTLFLASAELWYFLFHNSYWMKCGFNLICIYLIWCFFNGEFHWSLGKIHYFFFLLLRYAVFNWNYRKW